MMTVAGSGKREFRLRTWGRLVTAVVAVALLSGCVVVPAYGPYYRSGYYGQGGYYRDRDDYYRRW